jgi:hypothetical protein
LSGWLGLSDRVIAHLTEQEPDFQPRLLDVLDERVDTGAEATPAI